MAKPLSILFVSSEVYPFAKIGGLADVSYSLSLALRELGHDVRVMLPKYGSISERKNRIHEINRLRDIPIPVGDKAPPATVKSSSIQNPRVKVQAYITTNPEYFDAKKGIYADPATGLDYDDNDERFIFFCRSVVDTCIILGWFPDIIHCNDWQAALIPMYMKKMFPKEFSKTRSVFTIHNFSQQGTFPAKSIVKTGFTGDDVADLKHKNQLNLMKAGILNADRITTVSPTYAEEILKDKTIGNGLNTCLKDRLDVFKGILNGIDPLVWNPKKDTLIPKQYDSESLDKKVANKEALLKKLNLPFNADTPVVGIVSRLTEQKGIPLLIDALEDILKENLQFVILGEGNHEYQDKLAAIAKKHTDKMCYHPEFDDELAHLIKAGADIFVMPSLSEPCGLSQMYALTYGTVPIVRATGGLMDTVTPLNDDKSEGNGFVFKNYEAKELLAAVQDAIETFKNKEVWKSIQQRGMATDFTWSASAKQYSELYYDVMK
jgi:starch synthase